ncbi:MAG: DNA-3-methyladenine glycosylase [Phycisphaerae bacterium]|jgi:DNA-3-methyladenine glycosylase II
MTKGSPSKDSPQGDGPAAVAARYLARRDRRLAPLIRQFGVPGPVSTPDPFVALVGSIVQQQVSMAAGTTIFRRLRALCPRKRLTPAAILALSVDELRSAGLSRQKVEYIHGVAEAFASRTLTRAGLRKMSDEEVITAATRLKGVGRWTAEMLLMFCLGRPDVWPIDDLGLRKAAQQLLGAAEPPTAAELTALGEPWRPYRSYASWYLWRSLGGPITPGVAL